MDSHWWQQLLSTPAREAALCFVDVETTGLTPRYGDRICEVALVTYAGDREIARYETLVNPQREISPGAAAVNGITESMVRDAPPFREVAGHVLRLLDGAVPVAHNAPFDLSFLSNELAIAGLPLPQHPALDTLAIARKCYSFRSNSLSSIANAFGISAGGHRALADALVTRKVFGRFLDFLEKGDRRMPLGELLSLQGGGVPWPVPEEQPLPPLPPELGEAVRAGRTLRLTYLSGQGTLTERSVDPIQVLEQREEVYLLGFCHLRQAQRTFRIDRIVRWETL